MENWKEIKGYEGVYFVSDKGKVKSFNKYKNGIILTPKTDKDGYLDVNLYKNKKRKTKRVHRLVAEAFIPNPKNMKMVNHKNAIKNDNRVDNLEWANHFENTEHAKRLNLYNKIYINKKELEDLYINKKLTQRDIAKMFGVSYSMIKKRMKEYNIQARSKKDANRRKKNITKEFLIEQFALGKTQKEIAETIGCTQALISRYKIRYKL